MKILSIAIAYLLVTQFAQANENKLDEPYFYYADLAVNSTQQLPQLNLSSINVDLLPEFNLGIGKKYPLGENWDLVGTLSVNYQFANFDTLESGDVRINGKYQSYGVLASGKVLYTGFSDSVSPYIQLDIRAAENQYQFDDNNFKKHGLDMKAIAGLEFSLDKNMSASIGFGYTAD